MSSKNGRPDILTFSGHYFDFLEPEKNVICIEDIAHGLANCCRFAGQCRRFYSVAQHSVLVSSLLPLEFRMAGLLHDAAEAYLGDVTRPLKQLLPEYKRIEERVERAIFDHFGVTNIDPSVKRADLIMLATEQRDLMPEHDDTWGCLMGIEPMQDAIEPWGPARSEFAFIQTFNLLRSLYKNGE